MGAMVLSSSRLTRRLKTWVPTAHKAARVDYANEILRKHQSTLDRYAYTDGTCFYLARGPAENEQKHRALLGKYVWRQASGADGLFDDNIGPSLYAKAQGLPVKMWGPFVNGRLYYYILPKDKLQLTTHCRRTSSGP